MKKIVSLLMTLALGLGLVTQGVHCTENAPKPRRIEAEKNTRWTLSGLLHTTWRTSAGIGAGYFAGRAITGYAYRAPQNRKFDDSTKTQLGLSAALCAALGIDLLYCSMQKNWAEKKRQREERIRKERIRKERIREERIREEWQKLNGSVAPPNAKIEYLEEEIAKSATMRARRARAEELRRYNIHIQNSIKTGTHQYTETDIIGAEMLRESFDIIDSSGISSSHTFYKEHAAEAQRLVNNPNEEEINNLLQRTKLVVRNQQQEDKLAEYDAQIQNSSLSVIEKNTYKEAIRSISTDKSARIQHVLKFKNAAERRSQRDTILNMLSQGGILNTKQKGVYLRAILDVDSQAKSNGVFREALSEMQLIKTARVTTGNYVPSISYEAYAKKYARIT